VRQPECSLEGSDLSVILDQEDRGAVFAGEEAPDGLFDDAATVAFADPMFA
jgi:hypothetical protein